MGAGRIILLTFVFFYYYYTAHGKMRDSELNGPTRFAYLMVHYFVTAVFMH
jgi:hypothetical protein